MEISNYNKDALIEACLFASLSFVSISKLADFLQCDENEVKASLDRLSEKYKNENSGLFLVNKEGEVSITTKPLLGEGVASFLQTRRAGFLSNAALEVLAIAAYNQPVTKTYISQVRGVSSSEIVESLVEKDLLCENGQMDLPGRPMGYVTTKKFLMVFNIDSLSDLPPIEQFAEHLNKESDETEQ